MTQETPTVRHAARVLLLDENGRVLLMRFVYGGRRWWCAPGGGLEAGETHESAARREIAEETGFDLGEPGPWIWSREHVFTFEGRLYHQIERYFLSTIPTFEPRPGGLSREEARVVDGLRWWSVGELDSSTEEFAPADLPALVKQLVELGPPSSPLKIGV